MKTNKIIQLLAVAGILLLPGCSLDEYNPSGGATVDKYIETPEGFTQLISSCYYPLTRSWTGGGEDHVALITEVGTDLWTCPRNEGYMKEFFYYGNLAATLGQLNEGWQSSYESINLCNAAIGQAPNVTYTDEAARSARVAEAHFLRAFFYFYLVEQFGGVYMPTTATSFPGTPTTDLPRSSVDEMYAQIFSDLDFAMKNLPLTQPANETGRVTRKAAYHLYAKAAMQYAVGYSPASKNELLTKALAAAEEVINNRAAHTVSLHAEPSQVFDVNNNKSNSEAVWVATHSSVASLNPRGTNYWNRVYKQYGVAIPDGTCGIVWKIGAGGEICSFDGRVMPTPNLLKLYGEKDTRYAAYFREEYTASKDYTWTAGDATKFGKDGSFAGAKTIKAGELAMRFTRQSLDNPQAENFACYDFEMVYTDDWAKNGTNFTYALNGFPALKKFETPGMYAGSTNKPWTYGDHLVYRLAETYLLAAEISYWQNNLPKAVGYFNTVRNRACAGHDGSMDIAAGDITVDFILAERARELCGEYTRFMDLKRMGKEKMTEYVQKNADIVKKGNAFNYDVHKVRPLPWNNELTYYGNPDGAQNPGY